jgi:O-antigen/teichoic acid export membrane protein
MRLIERWLPPGSFRARMIHNTGFILGGDMAILATGVVFTILAARVLGPAAYGLLQLSLTIVRFIDEFMDVRVEESIVRYLSEDLVHKNYTRAQAVVIVGYLTDIVLTALSVAAVFLVAPWVARVFFNLESAQEPTAILLVRLYSAILILKIMNGTSKTLLRVFEQFPRLGVYRSVKGLCDLLFGGVGLIWGTVGVVWGFLASAAVTTLLVQYFAWPMFRRLGPWNPAPLWPELRRMGRFMFQTNLSGYLKSLNKHADMLILGFFAPPQAAGYYRIAMSFANLLGVFAAPIGYVVFPTMSKMHALGEPAQLRRLIRRISGAMAAYSIPAAAAMALLAPPILALTVKSDFLPAIPACYVLLGAFIVANLTIWTRPATLAIGRPEVSTWGNAIQAVVAVGTAIVLVPRLASLGSAWAYFLGTLVANAVVVWLIHRRMSLVGEGALPGGGPRNAGVDSGS